MTSKLFIDFLVHIDRFNFPRAHMARFDCSRESKRRACFEGTRTDLLTTIRLWITQSIEGIHEEPTLTGPDNRPSPVQVSPIRHRIFWLTGVAGTGKSTIAQSVAEYCAKEKWLAASFFFSRDDGERNHPKLVFSTIAHQLGTTFHEPLMPLMQEAVKANPDIWYSDPSNQLQKLIIEPIRKSIARGQSFPSPAVIVLDALDECNDDEATSLIVSVLSAYINDLPFSIFLTSRPEPNIRLPFLSPHLESHTRPFYLHEISKSSIEHDIEIFLTRELNRVGSLDEGLRKSDWFTKDDIRTLVRLSDGLFIFAATAIRFIEDPNACNPRGQLRDLVSVKRFSEQSIPYPYWYLDQLYLKVLRNAFPLSTSTNTLARLRMILGCIVVLCDPLSTLSISVLLGHDNSKDVAIESILQRLHSIIIIPSNPGAVRVMHASFPDFIVDQNRCTEPDFLIDTSLHHTCLTIDCLNQLNSLERDICKIKDFSKVNREIRGISTRVARNIPPAVQYACRHWANHLAHSLPSDKLFELLQTFCFHRSLYWLEALSLMDSLDVAIPALRRARQTLSVSCCNQA
jgi:hypothetical protein